MKIIRTWQELSISGIYFSIMKNCKHSDKNKILRVNSSVEIFILINETRYCTDVPIN